MCDTLVALGNVTADGVTLFGKNSDREPNEAHHLLRIPAADHPAGSTVKCTYIDIPQVAHTHAILLAKPFWMWGAEMGANEHGVTIGNEAVFTKVPYDTGPGLIGMDFIRLALERAGTARQALDVMIDLLERHGQGGNCGFQHALYYHNSFIIADPRDAWVFETAGRQWAAVQVKDVYTISNGITIGGEWDLASGDLVAYAVDRKWCKSRDDFHFGRCYSDFVFTRFSFCRERQCRTTDLLSAQRGRVTVESIMRALRDHGPSAGLDWTPARGLATVTVCWHAGFGPIRASQSVGSMVSHLAPDVQTHFVTGTSAPCTSLFKPAWLDAGLPDTGPTPTGTYDEATLFWRHEALHRATLRDYATRAALYCDERDALEGRFVQEALACRETSSAERSDLSARCFAEADRAEAHWLNCVRASGGSPRSTLHYDLAWRGFNRAAQMPIR
jgi:dipeptidase